MALIVGRESGLQGLISTFCGGATRLEHSAGSAPAGNDAASEQAMLHAPSQPCPLALGLRYFTRRYQTTLAYLIAQMFQFFPTVEWEFSDNKGRARGASGASHCMAHFVPAALRPQAEIIPSSPDQRNGCVGIARTNLVLAGHLACG